MILKLLENRADVNTATVTTNYYYYLKTYSLLQIVTRDSYLEVIKRLLTVNTNVNAAVTVNNNWIILQVAAKREHFKIMKRLLIINTNVNTITAAVVNSD